MPDFQTAAATAAAIKQAYLDGRRSVLESEQHAKLVTLWRAAYAFQRWKTTQEHVDRLLELDIATTALGKPKP